MSTVTPDQTNTRLELDVPEVVTMDGFWNAFRGPGEIATLGTRNKGADSTVCRNMRYWSTGCWTLAPIQEHFAFSSEYIPPELDPDSYQFKRAEDQRTRTFDMLLTAVAKMEVAALWGAPIGQGFVHPEGKLKTGDQAYRRVVAAGGTWGDASTISPPPPQYSSENSLIPGVKEFGSPNVALDCLYYSGKTQPANQGYFLRWLCPGSAMNSPDVILNLSFGQYTLVISGDGKATIAEYCRPPGGGPYRWKKRDTFRYCHPSRAVDTPHSLLIFPHMGIAGQKYIVFSGSEMDSGTGTPGLLTAGSGDQTTINDEYVYHASEVIRYGDMEDDPSVVTLPGPMRLDCRRDQRIVCHTSLLVFANHGGLVDSCWGVPDYTVQGVAKSDYPARPFKANVRADLPQDKNGNFPSITTVIADAATKSTTDIKTPYTTHEFFGTGTVPTGYSYTTPILWMVELYKDATLRVVNPGMFSVPTGSVSLGGIAGPDPRGEHGQVEGEEKFGANAARLNNRGRLAARVVTDVTMGGQTYPTVLQRGYAIRPLSTRYGKPGRPNELWSKYTVPLSGIADRASAVSGRTIVFKHFAQDDNAAPYTDGPFKGQKPAWKITDIIRFVLQNRGWPASQVIVPDLPQRLWAGNKGFEEDSIYDVHSDPIERCVTLARNYLKGYLIWDANAGPLDSYITGNPANATPMGAWRLLLPPPRNAAPVWNFVTAQQHVWTPDGKPILPWGKAAYDANTTAIEGHVQRYVIPPEGNHLWVMTAPPLNGAGQWRFEQHAFNPKSYEVPGMTTAPDPTSPHFLGYEQEIIVPDQSLWVPGNDKGTQLAVDYTTRIVFDFACLGRYLIPFKAPLVMVMDADTGRPRPLRYYDPITINGQGGWYLRSASYDIHSRDHRATYEAERIVPLLGT